MQYYKKLFTRNILLSIGFISSISTSYVMADDNVEAVAGAVFKHLRFANKAALIPAPTTAAPQAAAAPAAQPAAAPAAEAPTANTEAGAPVDQTSAAPEAEADPAGDAPIEGEADASAGTGDEGIDDGNPEAAA